MTIMVKYAHGCNSGMKSMVVTNHSLIRFQLNKEQETHAEQYVSDQESGWRDRFLSAKTIRAWWW